MPAFEEDFGDDVEGAQRAPKLLGHDKLPKTPDFSERMVPSRRPSPFVLDDFSGSAESEVNP